MKVSAIKNLTISYNLTILSWTSFANAFKAIQRQTVFMHQKQLKMQHCIISHKRQTYHKHAHYLPIAFSQYEWICFSLGFGYFKNQKDCAWALKQYGKRNPGNCLTKKRPQNMQRVIRVATTERHTWDCIQSNRSVLSGHPRDGQVTA